MKTDWLRLEHNIRLALKEWQKGTRSDKKTIHLIDEIVAEATRRGNEIEGNLNNQVWWK